LGGRFINGSGAWRGEGVKVCLEFNVCLEFHVIASAAKQSILTVARWIACAPGKLALSCR
jgi:hypothetical protein